MIVIMVGGDSPQTTVLIVLGKENAVLYIRGVTWGLLVLVLVCSFIQVIYFYFSKEDALFAHLSSLFFFTLFTLHSLLYFSYSSYSSSV